MTHFTSDSTLPFWLPARPARLGVEVEFGRQLQQRGMPDRLLLGVTPGRHRLHVVEDQHPGHPAQRQDAVHQPRNSVSWRISVVKRTQVQRLYFSRHARK